MVQIEKDGYNFSVDIEKTKEYYNTHPLCDCVCCCNFYAQIEKALPKLKEFLEEFGVDISKPDEISSIESDNCIDYLSVDYTVCGEIANSTEYEIDIQDNLFLSIVVSDGFVSPNEQQGTYFTLSVVQIKLPWVLDEPFPTPIKVNKPRKFANLFTRSNNIKLFLKKFFKSEKENECSPIPLIEEIVDVLYDKNLSFSDYEVIKVIYSRDKTKRFILLKSIKGFYKYTYEEICVLDEEEWVMCCNFPNAYPAHWEPKDKSYGYSFFGTENEAFLSMKQEYEYIQYFE